MSTLWRAAAAAQLTGAWHNSSPDDLDEETGRAGESMPDRRKRYISMIVDRHNVSRPAATRALKHVYQGLSGDSPFDSIRHYDPHERIRSVGGQGNRDYYSHHEYETLNNPKTWAGRKVEQVPLDSGVHASQPWVRPKSMAHNLFHPGQREHPEEELVGDPDFGPDNDRDMYGDEEEEGGSELTAEQRALHNVPKFVRRPDGSHEIVDGHHRAVTDALLGKKHTPGHVISQGELRQLAAGQKAAPAPATIRSNPRAKLQPEPRTHSGLVHHMMTEHAHGSWAGEEMPQALQRQHEADHDLDADIIDHHHGW
jgi:hypothetical protein